MHGRTAICFRLFLRSPGKKRKKKTCRDFNTVDRGRWIDRVTERILGRVMARDARIRQPGETHTESESVLLWDSPVIPNEKKKKKKRKIIIKTEAYLPIYLHLYHFIDEYCENNNGRNKDERLSGLDDLRG